MRMIRPHVAVLPGVQWVSLPEQTRVNSAEHYSQPPDLWIAGAPILSACAASGCYASGTVPRHRRRQPQPVGFTCVNRIPPFSLFSNWLACNLPAGNSGYTQVTAAILTEKRQ